MTRRIMCVSTPARINCRFCDLDSTGGVAKAFGEIRLTPTSVLIDKNGNVVKRYLGEPDFNELHAQIEKLLKA